MSRGYFGKQQQNDNDKHRELVLRGSPWHEMQKQVTDCNISSRLWEMTELTVLCLHNVRLRYIPHQVANLVNLIYLDVSNNLLQFLPPQIGSLSLLRVLYLHNNFLQTLPLEMGYLCHLNTLTLSGNPLTLDIITIYSDVNGTINLIRHLRRKLLIREPRPQRPWLHLKFPAPNSFTFTIMSYNILCERYATKGLYGYCPPWALNWNYRKRFIIAELVTHSADIITLQELEYEQFETTFTAVLEKFNYQGIFIPKSRVRTMLPNEQRHVDGCAIFYQVNKFRLLKKHIIEFNQISFSIDNDVGYIQNRVRTKDNVAVAALFETVIDETGSSKETLKQLLLVCTVHIHWDPANSDVKIVQTIMLLNELRKFLDRCFEEIDISQYDIEKENFPVIISGDFNSLPDSGVIELLLKGRLSLNHRDFLTKPYGSSLMKFSSSNLTELITHDFKISTAYENILPFTNYTLGFKGIIDYIFFTQNSLRVLELLGCVDTSWMAQNRLIGCPHPCFPSDHIPLITKFEIIRPCNVTNTR